jgi:parallel beta-helix repeat protein
LYVGGSGPGNYTSIQDAIDDANDGDTVFVYNGIYHETIDIEKSINLIGENKHYTIIDGAKDLDAIEIISNNVYIEGFTIQRSYYGIHLKHNMNNIIENNIICANYRTGIKLESSHNNNIIGNKIIHNTQFGISILNSNKNEIKINTIANNNDNGIYSCLSDNNYFSENNIMDNNVYGFFSYKSNNVTLVGNTFLNHSEENAIYIGNSYNITISYNTIKNSNRNGIKIDHSLKKNKIFRNTIVNNRGCGIYIWNCSNHEIYLNNIEDNYIGILLWDADSNGIYINNIINNNISAFFNNCSKNKWRGNYWDRGRLLPFPIFGKIFGKLWFNVDWRPAFLPNKI